MQIFTKRNAVIGWVVARMARKRLERRLNALPGTAEAGGVDSPSEPGWRRA